MKYDRSSILRRAHVLRRQNGVTMSDAMKAAWAEAKAPNAVAPQRLPLEAVALGVVAMARKVRDARIEAGFRVKVDVGLRVTPKGEMPMAFVKRGEIGAGFVTGR